MSAVRNVGRQQVRHVRPPSGDRRGRSGSPRSRLSLRYWVTTMNSSTRPTSSSRKSLGRSARRVA